MIISASRRTDIPAFYSRWFMHRVRDGSCLVPNPFNAKQVSRISLAPRDVDAFVFWSKNPHPMFEHLDELERRGFIFYFLFTLNDYPADFEPRVPRLTRRIETFRQLSGMLGPDRVIWRYDPIIISTKTPYAYHRERFARLSGRLSGLTNRVIISFVDYYRKTDRRLSALGQAANKYDKDAANNQEARDLLGYLKRVVTSEGIEIRSCAQEQDFSDQGILPGGCIDGEKIGRLGRSVKSKKDPGQRGNCRCVISRDIGVGDTCLHGCPYCYATRNNDLPKRRYAEHDSASPVLWGEADTAWAEMTHKTR